MTDEDVLWSAIADPTRRRVLEGVLAHGAASASTLAGELPVTRQAIAKHLDVLGQAGLVVDRKDGRERLWLAEPTRVDEAAQILARVAGDWDRRLAKIKELAEAAERAAGQRDPQGG